MNPFSLEVKKNYHFFSKSRHFLLRMYNICLSWRKLGMTVVRVDRPIKYLKPKNQLNRDKDKMSEFRQRMATGMAGALPKSYHAKMRNVRADQTHWDKMESPDKYYHVQQEGNRPNLKNENTFLVVFSIT